LKKKKEKKKRKPYHLEEKQTDPGKKNVEVKIGVITR
jgi:hypothetical protein